MPFRNWLLLLLALALRAGAPALAQQAESEVARLRSAALEKQWSRELPRGLAPRDSWSWQLVAPKAWRRSLRPNPEISGVLAPRLAKAEQGYVERFRPATEPLSLGLAADPPRPEYPLLAAGAKKFEPSLPAGAVVQLAPLGRSSEAPLALQPDAAARATKPYTAPLATATRGAAPPGTGIGIPDPFIVEREVQLRQTLPDVDPPAISLGIPERPALPVSTPPKP